VAHHAHRPCGAVDPRTGVLCWLTAGHLPAKDHAGTVRWTDAGDLADDDAPTLRMPPIQTTARRRPPPPNVRELRGRAELLHAIANELANLVDDDDEDGR
jgi:hypothetical protein